jgi:hypothetical protein
VLAELAELRQQADEHRSWMRGYLAAQLRLLDESERAAQPQD